MSIFTRKKKNAGQDKASKASSKTGAETSPQKVGIVSSVLPSGADSDERTPFSDIVAKRFGPSGERKTSPPTADAPTVAEAVAETPPTAREPLGSIDPPLFTSEEPELETDPMTNIGRATTITGNIVAEEDLEIHGTIEGSVQLVEHQVTVGADGLVKASVEAKIVLVHGKITGDVTASDLIEVKPGGIVGGDVKAPRVIMHDGAVIVGSLDMSAALPSSTNAPHSEKKSEQKSNKASGNEMPKKGERPVLKQVGLPPVHGDQGADSNANQG